MGVNLCRVRFDAWVAEMLQPAAHEDFMRAVRRHVGPHTRIEDWAVADDDYPGLGSYGLYDHFRHSMFFVHAGHFDDEMYDASRLEPEARKAYEERLKPSPDGIPYAATILDAGDSSTLFVPALFEEPLHFADKDDFVLVTSLPGAVRALEGFAAAVGFDLKTELEPEVVDEVWDPIATCRNTARMMYAFFDEKPDACVEFG